MDNKGSGEIVCKFPYTLSTAYTRHVKKAVIPIVDCTYGHYGVDIKSRESRYTGPDRDRLPIVRIIYEQLPLTVCQTMEFVAQPGDGSCLFHALGFIVGITGYAMRNKICDWYASTMNAREIRQMNQHANSNSLDPHDKPIDGKYITYMRLHQVNGKWVHNYGGDREITVFTKLYPLLHVLLYNPHTKKAFQHGTVGTYRNTIILCYTGEHYDSLIPRDETAYNQFILTHYPATVSSPSLISAPKPSHTSPMASTTDMMAILDDYAKHKTMEENFFKDLYAGNKKALRLTLINIADKKKYETLFDERLRMDLESVAARYEGYIHAVLPQVDKVQNGGANIFYKSQSDVHEFDDHRMKLLVGKYTKYANRLKRLNRII